MDTFYQFGALSGSGRYIRQEKPGVMFYPAGLDSAFNLSAFPFAKPAAGQRALGFLNGTAGVGKLQVADPDGELGGS